MIYYVVRRIIDSPTGQSIKEVRFFSKHKACKYAIKYGGLVRKVILKIEKVTFVPLGWYELLRNLKI